MTTVQAALAAAAPTLRAAGIDDPMRDARRLMAFTLGVEPGRLTLVLPEPIGAEALATFEAAIARRAERQPVSQIIGSRAFYGREFIVTPDVLDPRPETELLVATAVGKGGGRVLDLGTGSGAILVSFLCECPEALGVGTDVSAAALEVAARNAARYGVAERMELLHSDWFDQVDGKFDLILSNPPYISEDEMQALTPEVAQWEPHGALSPGGDGLDAYRAICRGAGAHLQPGGWLIVEIGAAQGKDVSALFAAAGFAEIATLADLDGRDRVVLGRKPSNYAE